MDKSKRIPSLVRTSISELERLSSTLGESLSYLTESAITRSHLSKLKLWSGCLGAHRVAGTRSLSYRLRDASSIRQTVLFLLENLERYVNEAQSIAQQHPYEHKEEEYEDDSTDEELAEYFRDNDSDGSPDNSELRRVLSQMEDVLDCLMRLAVTISNPAPYDQFRSRAGVVPYPYEWDIAHVQQKFPDIDPVISERLGTALTQRRRYFKYREEHHLRLQEGLNGDNDDDGSKGKGTTIASSLPHESRDTAPAALEDTEDTYSEVSTTSYATTSADQGQRRIPPIPKDHINGPFLCPFCYMLISVDAESDWKARLEWKKHVYRDLHPYVCLENHCTKASQDFQKRKQWARHMFKAHWRTWTCPFGCALSFRTSIDFRCHALAVHPTQVSTGRVENLVALSSNSDPRCAEGKCPLCLAFDIKDSRMYESHVGEHLEQLSLFVLPQIDDDESEQDEGTVLLQVSDDESERQSEQDDGAEDDQHGSMNPPCGLVRGCQRPRMRFQDGRQAIHCDLHIPCAKSGQGCRQIAASYSDFCLTHKCSLEGCADGKELSSHYCKKHTCFSSGCHGSNIRSNGAKYCSAHECLVDQCFYEAKIAGGFCLAHTCAHSSCYASQLRMSPYCREHCCRHNKCDQEALHRNSFCRSHSCIEKGCEEPRLDGREHIRQCLGHWTRDLREDVAATNAFLQREELPSDTDPYPDSEPEDFRPQHAGPSITANAADALLIDERVREISDSEDDQNDDFAHLRGSDAYMTVERYELERRLEEHRRQLEALRMTTSSSAATHTETERYELARLKRELEELRIKEGPHKYLRQAEDESHVNDES